MVYEKKALIIIDMQNDFLPGGALGVKEADRLIPIINKLLNESFDVKFATQDFHPSNHGSFALNQGKKTGEKGILGGVEQILWPVHCVQGSWGAELCPKIDWSQVEKIFYKGIDPTIDSYSGFFDNAKKRSTGLLESLLEKNIKDVYLAGIATDYCVLFSALDSLELGFQTFVFIDACVGVNLHEGDSEKALQRMKMKGISLLNSSEFRIKK